MPHPAEGPQPPVLSAPAAPTIAAPVDAVRADEAATPTLSEALPTPFVAPAPAVEREAIAPPMAGEAATPPTPHANPVPRAATGRLGAGGVRTVRCRGAAGS